VYEPNLDVPWWGAPRSGGGARGQLHAVSMYISASISNHASLSVAAMYPNRHLNIDPAVIYQAKGNADNKKRKLDQI